MSKWIVGLLFITVLGLLVYFFANVRQFTKLFPNQVQKVVQDDQAQSDGRCLSEGEIAEHTFQDNKRQSDSFVTITVKNSDTGDVLREFTETILSPTHYHPIEKHKCGVYFAQQQNYDYTKKQPLLGYRAGIWKFDYRGFPEEIVTISDALDGTRENSNYYFSSDFRVSPDEKMITLVRGYSNEPGYAFIIKNFQKKEDVFTLPAKNIWQKNEHLIGDIMFLDWTRNGQYFWFNLFEGAYVNGWVRIDTRDWSYELFEAPEGVLGGYPLNLETGWVPVIPGAFWTGVVEFNKEIEEERAVAGETADLYLYNVFSKQRILVEDTDLPTWQGLHAVWVDDHTLEYDHPDGTRRTYRVR